jgi:hypothetical protein
VHGSGVVVSLGGVFVQFCSIGMRCLSHDGFLVWLCALIVQCVGADESYRISLQQIMPAVL